MRADQQQGPDHLAKVVVSGLPGSGRAAILRQMARRHAHDSVRVGEVAGGAVHRTEFYWPDELADGRRLRVRLFALAGCPVFNAVSELLLTGVDGLVFAVDAREDRLGELREGFRALVFNLGRAGRDFRQLPLVLQYHHRSERPDFSLDAMDRWLGLEPGCVSRLTVRHPVDGMGACAGLEQVIGRIAREACPRREMMES